MLNKKEVFLYLNSNIDKSGFLKKEIGFSKKFPEFYKEFLKVEFPKELKELSFQQKLWHFLQDDFTIHRCECGKELHFIDFKKGYRTYCSKNCPCLINHNNETIQLAQLSSRKKESRKKAVNTIIEKNGGKFWSDENLEKIRKPYKNDIERCEKLRKSLKEKRPIMNEKIRETLKENIKKFTELTGKKPNGCSSKIEILFYKYLIDLFGFENVEPQYYGKERYPFSCDFYISKIDLFIEIQGTWTHCNHPFNKETKEDIEQLEFLKEKSKESNYYKNTIYTWTDLDVRKRRYVEENNLNYLEIFSDKIDICIKEFEEYIKKLLVDWCLKNDFPGTQKWPANHPIWDCNVANLKTPRNAWYQEKYITKAVNNLIWILKKDYPDFRKSHIDEFLKCEIHNNEITKSTKRLLELILNRFTIAKIAPKVTALSAPTFEKIIEESGIDLSCGAYLPMAGFGGIYEGVKRWCKKHKKDIDYECYDINPHFCEWYGWKQRDMLTQKIKTDKICVVCPPFGKEYEQWEGTPKEMSSDISFFEWYWLIKEYVDAPDYIIVGPEIDLTGTGSNKGLDGKGKKRNGLFSKTVGVMRWTDEMMEKYKKES